MTTITISKEKLLAYLIAEDIEVEKEVVNKAKVNDAESLSKIADIYYEKKDYSKAIGWYRLAAGGNNAHSQWRIGYMYHYGEDVSVDYKLAMEWYKKASNNGHTRATNGIGTLYLRGQGIYQDYKTALKWFLEAANKGDKVAKYNVGVFYENGIGVKKDMQYALEWYEKSVEQGYEKAKISIERLNQDHIYLNDRQKRHIQMENDIMEQKEKIRKLELINQEKNNEIRLLKQEKDNEIILLKRETANQIRLLKQETANETRILKQELEVLKLNINVSKMEKMEPVLNKDQIRQLINELSKMLNEDDDSTLDICYDG